MDTLMGLSRVNPRLTSMNQHPTLDRLMANVSTIQTSLGINIGCFMCKAAVGTALKTLSSDKVLTLLQKDTTDLVCKIFPSTLKAGCLDFMGIYFKAALQLTLDEWTPAEICTDIHACNAAFLQQIESLSMVEKSAVTCDACKVLSKILAVELQQQKFQQEIIDVLTRGCQILPAKFGDKVRIQCQSYVETYMPYILEDTVAISLLPHLCATLRLC